jgi:hypothetical protein
MKRLIIVASAIICLSSNVSFAGEGSGTPFEYTNPVVTSVASSAQRLPAKGQDPFPFRVMDRVVTMTPFALVPSERSEAVVQTENALPSQWVSRRMAGQASTSKPRG